MWKFKRKVTQLDGKSSFVASLNDLKDSIYRLVFAIAMSMGVSPTKIANNLVTKKQVKYAERLNKAIEKRVEKEKKAKQKEVDHLL